MSKSAWVWRVDVTWHRNPMRLTYLTRDKAAAHALAKHEGVDAPRRVRYDMSYVRGEYRSARVGAWYRWFNDSVGAKGVW